MMPPTNVTPTALYSTLMTLPRPFRVIAFPRVDDDGKPIGEVAIRALNGAEYLACNTAAEGFARAQFPTGNKDNVGYLAAYTDGLRLEQLYRSVRDVDDTTRPLFPSPKAIRECLTVEEIAALYLMMLEVVEQIGPVINGLSDGEADAWIERLIDGGESGDPAFFLSSGNLKILLKRSVSQLATLRTGRSFAGTRLGEPHDDEHSDEHQLMDPDGVAATVIS